MVNLDRLLPFAEPGAKALLIAAAFNAPLAYLICFAKFVSFRSLDFAPQLMLAAGVAILMTGINAVFDVVVHVFFPFRARYRLMTVTALVFPSCDATVYVLRTWFGLDFGIESGFLMGGGYIIIFAGFIPWVIGNYKKKRDERRNNANRYD